MSSVGSQGLVQVCCVETQFRRKCALFGVSAQEPGESGVFDVNRER